MRFHTMKIGVKVFMCRKSVDLRRPSESYRRAEEILKRLLFRLQNRRFSVYHDFRNSFTSL